MCEGSKLPKANSDEEKPAVLDEIDLHIIEYRRKVVAHCDGLEWHPELFDQIFFPHHGF